MRKRGILRRKWTADPQASLRTLSKVQPFTAREILALETPVRLAWHAFKTSQATSNDFHNIAAALNVALIRAEDIDQLAVDMCQRAMDALMRVKFRHDRIGTWGLDWMSMAHVPPALDFYDQLIELSTPLQMQAAMTQVMRRMEQGHTL
jgi:hypothetical protein